MEEKVVPPCNVWRNVKKHCEAPKRSKDEHERVDNTIGGSDPSRV